VNASIPAARVSHPRGEAVAQTVIEATLALLAERGYEFSIDDVAERARVHKTTIYRRWETKARLVAAAMRQIADRDVTAPGSGDVLADLEHLAVQVARALRRPAAANALRAALSTAGADPELRTVAAEFLASRYETATRVLRAAQHQGIIQQHLDPTLIWRAIVNPLHLNAVIGGPLTDGTAHALCRIVLDGARVPGTRTNDQPGGAR
jgi:AcrR family transcriptional regulator